MTPRHVPEAQRRAQRSRGFQRGPKVAQRGGDAHTGPETPREAKKPRESQKGQKKPRSQNC